MFDADADCSRVAAMARARGVGAVGRYFKNLHAPEAAALHAAGLGILLIFETSAERALGGAAAGRQDGNAAAAFARVLGAPDGTTVWLTADFDVTLAQQAAVLAYAEAFNIGVPGYRCGVYANGATCAAALDAGIAKFAWVAGGRGMRGTPEFVASGRAAIVQDVGDAAGLNLGIAIDSGTAVDGDIGAWLPGAVLPPVSIPDARALQRALNAAGAKPQLAEDGVWGPASAAALKIYYGG